MLFECIEEMVPRTHMRLKTSKRAAPSLRSGMVVTGRARSYVAKNAKNAFVSLRWASIVTQGREVNDVRENLRGNPASAG